MLTFSSLGKLGRLGNQLWQIASTIGIAKRNNLQYEFPHWNYNKYFNDRIPEGKSITTQITMIDNQGTEYVEYNLNPYTDHDLYGYFQSYKYFEYNKDLIRELFKFNFETNDTGSVAVHVRRGDYLERSNFHTNLTMDYYEEAMSRFPNSTFDIFSDDIEWCMDNFDKSKCNFVRNDLDIVDLAYMSKHKHVIIANSSFSWWGAYLGNHWKIIAPKNWYVYLPSDDICPPDWIRI